MRSEITAIKVVGPNCPGMGKFLYRCQYDGKLIMVDIGDVLSVGLDIHADDVRGLINGGFAEVHDQVDFEE